MGILLVEKGLRLSICPCHLFPIVYHVVWWCHVILSCCYGQKVCPFHNLLTDQSSAGAFVVSRTNVLCLTSKQNTFLKIIYSNYKVCLKCIHVFRKEKNFVQRSIAVFLLWLKTSILSSIFKFYRYYFTSNKHSILPKAISIMYLSEMPFWSYPYPMPLLDIIRKCVEPPEKLYTSFDVVKGHQEYMLPPAEPRKIQIKSKILPLYIDAANPAYHWLELITVGVKTSAIFIVSWPYFLPKMYFYYLFIWNAKSRRSTWEHSL